MLAEYGDGGKGKQIGDWADGDLIGDGDRSLDGKMEMEDEMEDEMEMEDGDGDGDGDGDWDGDGDGGQCCGVSSV